MNFHAQLLSNAKVPINPQWTFQNQTQAMALLPPIVTSVNQSHSGTATIPTPFAASNPQQFYKLNIKAQVQLQTQQIDSAIQLLKMQYDSIMASVQHSNAASREQQTASASAGQSSEAVDQSSFAVQFELPGPECDCEHLGSGPHIVASSATRGSSHKRKQQRAAISEDSEAELIAERIENKESTKKRKCLGQSSSPKEHSPEK